jgi:hypothetical protein
MTPKQVAAVFFFKEFKALEKIWAKWRKNTEKGQKTHIQPAQILLKTPLHSHHSKNS